MDYYYKGEPLGWAAKAIENFAEFRRTLEAARENPAYVDARINDSMEAFRLRSMWAMRYGTSVKTIEAVLSVFDAIRSQKMFFLYLLERVDIDEREEKVVEHALHMARLSDESDRLRHVLNTDHSLHDIEQVVRAHEGHAKDAGAKPLQLRFLLYKLSEVQKALSDKE